MTMQADPSQPLIRRRHSFDIFVCMIVVSILLHAVAAVFFVMPGRFSPPGSAPLFVELQSPAAAPPVSTEPVQPEQQESQPPPAAVEPASEAATEQTTETGRLEKAVESSLRKAVKEPESVHESSIGLGMLSGRFESFAEGESLKDEIRVYYFSLMRRINEVWWTSGTARRDFGSVAAVNLVISREGKLLATEILQSSGNAEHDRALLAAIKAAEPLPPLPRSYLRPTFSAPIRFAPPLRLMVPGFTIKKH